VGVCLQKIPLPSGPPPGGGHLPMYEYLGGQIYANREKKRVILQKKEETLR
jgi:hypothetical protein